MAHASLAAPFAPLLDQATLDAAWNTARRATRLAGRLAACAGAAALMWLILAGPGFVSDHASTAPRHASR